MVRVPSSAPGQPSLRLGVGAYRSLVFATSAFLVCCSSDVASLALRKSEGRFVCDCIAHQLNFALADVRSTIFTSPKRYREAKTGSTSRRSRPCRPAAPLSRPRQDHLTIRPQHSAAKATHGYPSIPLDDDRSTAS